MLIICLIVGLYMSIKHVRFIKELFLWNLRKDSFEMIWILCLIQRLKQCLIVESNAFIIDVFVDKGDADDIVRILWFAWDGM